MWAGFFCRQDVSISIFGRTKEFAEVRGTSLMCNFGVRSRFLDVIYGVRPPNGSPGSLQRTLTEQNQNKWNFTDAIQCCIGHDGRHFSVIVAVCRVPAHEAYIAPWRSVCYIVNIDSMFYLWQFQLNISTSHILQLVNCSIFNVWNTTFQLNVQTSYCKRFTKKKHVNTTYHLNVQTSYFQRFT